MTEMVNVPAGAYLLSDPCYNFSDYLWDELLAATDFFEAKSFHLINGLMVVGFSTSHGDGEYHDNFGNLYPVDAGLLGLTHVDLIDQVKLRSNMEHKMGHVILFDSDTWCTNDRGFMKFGKIEIDTRAYAGDFDRED
jgi:hypothetical protein